MNSLARKNDSTDQRFVSKTEPVELKIIFEKKKNPLLKFESNVVRAVVVIDGLRIIQSSEAA